jgi:peroxiredoxin Q/BCP
LFGATTDKPEKVRAFAESLELDFPILSDPTKKTARAYGVLKLGLFAARHTIYIGPDGNVLHVDRNVSARSAGRQVAARLASLGPG